MKTLKLLLSPAVLIAVWIVAAAFTLSQLTTVAPSLLSVPLQSQLEPGGDLPA